MFATCNFNAWKALSHHQTHSPSRQSAELYYKGSNYITQPNDDLIIEDGGHLVFDQGSRDRLWAGERGGGGESSLPFPNQPLPHFSSRTTSFIALAKLSSQYRHVHPFTCGRGCQYLSLNTWRNNICMEFYILFLSSTMFIRECSSKSFIFHFILSSVDPKNKFRERGSSSQESGYQ